MTRVRAFGADTFRSLRSRNFRLFAPDATLLDEYSWANHPAIDGSEAAASWARCPDATGPWSLARVTPGAANDCVLPKVQITEVESNGDATDWVEVVNAGTEAVDLTGWTVMDNDPVGHAADVTPVAAGTLLAPCAYFVFDGPVVRPEPELDELADVVVSSQHAVAEEDRDSATLVGVLERSPRCPDRDARDRRDAGLCPTEVRTEPRAQR